MIVYNVTVQVEEEVCADWLRWMKQTHIPDVMRSGEFLEYRMLKLLNEVEGTLGTTFAIQYSCESMDNLQRYLEHHAPALQREHQQRYEGKFVAFRTFLETI